MITIDAKRIPFYFLIFIVILIISTFGKKLSEKFERSEIDEEYELIRKYLLNDSSLVHKKPKLWIHSNYINRSKVCKPNDASSLSELEHPYINLMVETIVEHCHNDFDICLIDDDSFSKLIPSWSHKINDLPDPHKKNCRDLGMATILYIYGGIIVPNSFLCLKNLKGLYDTTPKPFVGEFVNNKEMTVKNNKRILFIPDTILIGAKKEDIVIKEMVEYYTTIVNDEHFSSERDFKGKSNAWILNLVKLNRINLIDGKYIGTKTINDKPLILENLMDNTLLPLNMGCFGIFVPHDELLKRIQYKWFSLASYEEVIKSKTSIAKYLTKSVECIILSSKNSDI